MSLAIFLLFGFVCVNAVAYNHARALLRFSVAGTKTKNPEELGVLDKLRVLLLGVSNPKPVDTAIPTDRGLAYQSHVIPVGHRVRLGAWFIPHPAANSGVIMFHGFTASKCQLLPEAAAFHARGYSVLMVDFRGSGESSEGYTTVGYDEAIDVDAAIRYAATAFGMSSPLVYARSMGACAVLRAVALGTTGISAIVLEGVFDRMLNTVKQRFMSMGVPSMPLAELLVFWGGLQNGFWAFGHNPVDDARKCRVPVLMLHGSEDPRATLAQARTVFEALATEKKTLCVFPGAGHVALLAYDESRWDEALRAFV